jgi:hypothetical protein
MFLLETCLCGTCAIREMPVSDAIGEFVAQGLKGNHSARRDD